MPALLANINDKVLESQRKTAASKLANALSLMHVFGKIEEAGDTDTFVENLKSYLKIVKVCEKSNLDACFVDTVAKTVSSTEKDSDLSDDMVNNIFFAPAYAMRVEHEIGSVSTGGDIKTNNLTLYSIYNSSYSTADLKGIVTVDGTSMLIGYVPDCTKGDNNIAKVEDSLLGYIRNFINSLFGVSPAYAMRVEHDISEFDSSKYPASTIMPISRDERACVVALIDVNYNKKPNKIEKDVFYFQANSEAVYSNGNVLAQPGDSGFRE